jgi:tagatose-6-phosphate ketose/aldose isomerase
MEELSGVHTVISPAGAPVYTLPEIVRQPSLWPDTLERVGAASDRLKLPAWLDEGGILVTGAGSSAYASSAVAAAWPRAVAVPTTDILLDAGSYLAGVHAVVSLARSGNSPESRAVVERVRELQPDILQLAIVCNEGGALSHAGLDALIALDPHTNDQSLVMTSSFSNLVLAGMALARPGSIQAAVAGLSERASRLLPEIDRACRLVAERVRDRIVILSSPPLLGWGREAGLKTLEMTAGHFPVVTETYLGLRHGPMSFVKRDTLVLCLLSSDPLRRLYEVDLIQELRDKKLGYLVGIAARRTPFEILGPQLLGYYLSLRLGLNPDNPSPEGVINRVVQGFKIYR